MELFLHDSQQGSKRTFEPIDAQRITMYVCGPTVYNYVHIGNGRPAVVFDTLYRLLQKLYPEVVYARNITDVDDKINQAAAENGEPIAVLSARFADAYEADLRGLNVLPPAIAPRATEHIPQIIAMIEKLIANGYAYEAEGHALFHVPADEQYGELSRRSLDDMLAGARVDVAPYKRDPKDYVLWKPSTDDLPGWDSPWGRGRPGWHIECSAMIESHLGERIDIHGGGSDLLFPHHENEAAQSRCALGHERTVNYWLHNGMLTLGSEKMSKSVGNVLVLHHMLEQYSGDLLRYALLAAHYRASLAWGEDLLTQAGKALDTFYQALRTVPALANASAANEADRPLDTLPEDFVQALLDDLNTPQAMAQLHALARSINVTSDDAEREALGRDLLACGWHLGILNTAVERYFQGTDDGDEATIQAQVDERLAAKAARDFNRADAIREQLLKDGIELEDTREGTRWRRL
ncbi:MAG: cysteine--tRNA ligase [Pseudomonadota bacterium]